VVVRTLADGEYVIVGEHEVRQRFLHGRWRVDLLRTCRKNKNGTEELWESKGEVKAFAYHHYGQGVRYFSSENHFGQVRVPGADQEVRVKQLAPHLFEAFKSHYYGESFFSIVAYRAASGTATKAATSVTLNLPSVTATAPHNFVNDDFIVELSTERGFLPTLIRSGVHLNANPEVVAEIRNEIGEIGSGLWAPVRSTKRVYAVAIAGNVETPVSEEELILDMERSKFNVDIRPEVCEMAFPPGTVVYEEANAANYVVNDGGEADYKAYAEIAKKKAEELAIKKLSTKKQRNRPVPYVLIAVNLLGLLAVLLFLLWRRQPKA